MRKITFLLVMLFLPSLALAQIYTTPSGAQITVLDNGATYRLVDLETPTGILIRMWQFIGGAIIPPALADTLPLDQQIRQYIITMAQFYGVNEDYMIRLADCESQFDIYNLNDHEPKGGPSFGLYQWQVGSWKKYNQIYKTDLDRNLWTDQTKMTAHVLSDGGENNWYNCSFFIKHGYWKK